MVLALGALAACGPSRDDPQGRNAAPDRCGECHLREFRRARRPLHVGQKPPTCGVCHTEHAWTPSTVAHTWPLTGAHAGAGCFACHRGDPVVFVGTPSNCWDCHEADYRRVRLAAHARFAHTCHDCHGTRAWSPTRERPEPQDAPPLAPPPAPSQPPAQAPRVPTAQPAPPRPSTNAHDGTHPESRFPIRRGNHTDVTCARCHRLPGPDGRDNTDCVQCHRRARFDPLHEGIGRYPQGAAPANFCVRCHRRGTR